MVFGNMSDRLQIMMLGPDDLYEIVQETLNEYDVLLCNTDDKINELLPSVNVILDAAMTFKFSSKRLSHASNLQLYMAASTSADHVDSHYLTSHDISLISLLGNPGLQNITVTAEHSWMLLLSVIRNLKSCINHVLSGKWNRMKFDIPMMRGKTLGIVGCGRIGTWMGRYAKSFGMSVLGSDPEIQSWEHKMCSLDYLLMNSDYVSIHVSCNNPDNYIIGRRELELMKHGAVIINTSVGRIINESALVEFLLSGKISGAGLDTLIGEPNISEELLTYARTHDNLLITPHVGGRSTDALVQVLYLCCGMINDFFHR